MGINRFLGLLSFYNNSGIDGPSQHFCLSSKRSSVPEIEREWRHWHIHKWYIYIFRVYICTYNIVLNSSIRLHLRTSQNLSNIFATNLGFNVGPHHPTSPPSGGET